MENGYSNTTRYLTTAERNELRDMICKQMLYIKAENIWNKYAEYAYSDRYNTKERPNKGYNCFIAHLRDLRLYLIELMKILESQTVKDVSIDLLFRKSHSVRPKSVGEPIIGDCTVTIPALYRNYKYEIYFNSLFNKNK